MPERRHHRLKYRQGIDGNKKVKGRKDQVVLDSLGFPLAVFVHEASIHNRKGAEPASEKITNKFPRLKKVLADSATGETS